MMMSKETNSCGINSNQDYSDTEQHPVPFQCQFHSILKATFRTCTRSAQVTIVSFGTHFTKKIH